MIVVKIITGASNRKSMESWPTSSATADKDLLPHLQTTRDRTRDLDRNSPAARGVLKALVNGVIGNGLRPRSSIDREFLGLSEEQAQEWQNNAEQEFRIWAETPHCDYMGQMNFYGLQRLAYYSQKTAGDCFVLQPWNSCPGVPYDLRIHLIEADRICNPDGMADDERIAGGVERNTDGIPIAIHIRTPHPGASYQAGTKFPPKWDRVPIYGEKTGRRNILHLMEVERIGQSRGNPVLSPVIETLKQITKYTEAEIAAAVINAMLAVVVITLPLKWTSGLDKALGVYDAGAQYSPVYGCAIIGTFYSNAPPLPPARETDIPNRVEYEFMEGHFDGNE